MNVDSVRANMQPINVLEGEWRWKTPADHDRL
jgi:hypothetical protein